MGIGIPFGVFGALIGILVIMGLRGKHQYEKHLTEGSTRPRQAT